MDNVTVAFSRAVRRVGDVVIHIVATPTIGSIYSMWFALPDLLRNLVCLRRIDFNRWVLFPHPNLQRNEDPDLRLLWYAVARD